MGMEDRIPHFTRVLGRKMGHGNNVEKYVSSADLNSSFFFFKHSQTVLCRLIPSLDKNYV